MYSEFMNLFGDEAIYKLDNRLDEPHRQPLILRIAQRRSVWCRKNLVGPDKWFTHKPGSRKVKQVLGSSIVCHLIEFVGVKAMQWRLNQYGRLPVLESNDPRSEVFQKCVDEGGAYGPVYRILGAPCVYSSSCEYELFCSNSDMYKFAKNELGVQSIQITAKLSVVSHNTPHLEGFDYAIV